MTHVWLLMVSMESARYFLIAGAAFLIFWLLGRERWRDRLIQGTYPRAAKMWHDVRWSVCTLLLFSVVGVATWYGGRSGVLRRYTELDGYGWAWLFASPVVMLVIQDTYFYWTHRAMHHRWLYRWVHKVHHASTNPSPWTAYAFAPAEALTHAAFVPLVWLVLPLHDVAALAFMFTMIVRNVQGHLSMEFYPRGFSRSRFWGWQTTTTHHSMHHKYFTANYGLYSTFWDRVMGTTHERYHQEFDRVASGHDRAAGRPSGQIIDERFLRR
jgi:Delta7-sterol 5-desaturase